VGGTGAAGDLVVALALGALGEVANGLFAGNFGAVAEGDEGGWVGEQGVDQHDIWHLDLLTGEQRLVAEGEGAPGGRAEHYSEVGLAGGGGLFVGHGCSWGVVARIRG
jgi:hypothetical protein